MNAELTPSLLDSVIDVHGCILNFLRPITVKAGQWLSRG